MPLANILFLLFCLALPLSATAQEPASESPVSSGPVPATSTPEALARAVFAAVSHSDFATYAALAATGAEVEAAFPQGPGHHKVKPRWLQSYWRDLEVGLARDHAYAGALEFVAATPVLAPDPAVEHGNVEVVLAQAGKKFRLDLLGVLRSPRGWVHSGSISWRGRADQVGAAPHPPKSRSPEALGRELAAAVKARDFAAFASLCVTKAELEAFNGREIKNYEDCGREFDGEWRALDVEASRKDVDLTKLTFVKVESKPETNQGRPFNRPKIIVRHAGKLYVISVKTAIETTRAWVHSGEVRWQGEYSGN